MEPVRASEKKQFPCSQCGAKLDFAPGKDALQCPYCGAQVQIPRSEEQIEELNFREALARASETEETRETQRVKCGKCGAETTMPPEISAGMCPFCGDNLVLTRSSSSQLAPKALLPFHVNQKQAFESFRRWISGLWFAPNDLKRYAQSEGKLVGVYVPYWTYDSDTTSDYRGQRGDDYHETETYTAYESGKAVTRTRRVTRTRWSPVSGTVRNSFDDILVLASKSLPRKQADHLEPWDLSKLVPYAEEYLSGFRAESYQIKLDEGFEIARGIMDAGVRESICRDIGGDHQRIESVKTVYRKITFKHVLLPVWLSAYRYMDRAYRILINARTGEVQGERPLSLWKIAAAVAAALVAVLILIALGTMNK